jgi:hypothetical protein
MLNYTWRLSSLKALTKINDDIISPITSVYWRLQVTENEKFAEVTGVQEFDTQAINKENFTEFSDLTKDDIIGWVQQDLGEEAVEAMKQDLANQLNL